MNLLVYLLVVPVTQEIDSADTSTTYQTNRLTESLRDDMKLLMTKIKESQPIFVEAFGTSMTSFIGNYGHLSIPIHLTRICSIYTSYIAKP